MADVENVDSPPAIQSLFPLVNRRFQSFAEAADCGLDVLARALPGTIVLARIDADDGHCQVLDVRGAAAGIDRGDILPQRAPGTAELDLGVLRERGLPGCVSLPLELSDGSFPGLVCALGAEEAVYRTEHVIALGLVARLLSLEWERVATAAELRRLRRRADAGNGADPETGLPDRAGFTGQLEREWRLARRGTVESLVLACEVRVDAEDEASGRAAGHKALRLAAEVLTAVARNTDQVGRIGPLALAVAMTGTGDAAGARALIERYAETLRRVSRERHAGISIACGFHPLAEAGSAEQALALAEEAAAEAIPLTVTAEVGLL